MSLSSVSFPPDLFYSHIIPDILSEHLHQLLVEGAITGWHPFYTLPLVSQGFRSMCKIMCTHIFDLKRDEGADKILSILGTAREFWAQARLSPLAEEFHPILHPSTGQPHTYEQLTSSKSLIQVYLCTAIAQSFFKFDVQRGLELDGRDLSNVDPERLDADTDSMDSDPEWSERPRRYKMRDEFMHRVYLPLACAIKLCDSILPDRLAYIIAKYLANIVPRYSTEPVLLKYTQDLEVYVIRQHRVDMETWVEWTSRTLGLIEGTESLLVDMQCIGKLVKSFRRSSSIPWQVIVETDIITALQDVMILDWGTDTDVISGRAANILEWLASAE